MDARLAFFSELVEVPTAPVLQHDLFKLARAADDMVAYLVGVRRWADSVTLAAAGGAPEGVARLLARRDEVTQAVRGTAAVDRLILRLLAVLEREASVPARLLAQFETATDLLLDARQQLAAVQRHVAAAVNYSDTDNVMSQLCAEARDCHRVLAHMALEQRLTGSLAAALGDRGLADVVRKLQQGLALFEQDTWAQLEQRVAPLRVSMQFLEARVAEFAASGAAAALHTAIDRRHRELATVWQLLTDDLDARGPSLAWGEVYRFVIGEATAVCRRLARETPDEAFAADYKLCSSAVTLVNRAFAAHQILSPELIMEYNRGLLAAWNALNEQLGGASEHANPGLRSYRIKPSRALSPATHSPGLDLGVGVAQVAVPLSVQTERVRDFLASAATPLKRINLLALDDDDDDVDDDATLVATRRAASMRTASEKWRFQLERATGATRIPVRCADYRWRSYPHIPRVRCRGSRVPVISPNHPVYAQLRQGQAGLARPVLGPPLVVSRTLPKVRRRARYGLVRRQSHLPQPLPQPLPQLLPHASRALGSPVRQPSAPSRIPETPPLTFQSAGWRLTSPDRPPSSIGLRFDDEHLLPPLTSPKRAWM
jgi:hypothetical protein